MTNGIAIVIAALVAGVFVLDAAVLNLDLPVLLGKQFAALVEWVSFWR